jgi:hypothetical protein
MAECVSLGSISDPVGHLENPKFFRSSGSRDGACGACTLSGVSSEFRLQAGEKQDREQKFNLFRWKNCPTVTSSCAIALILTGWHEKADKLSLLRRIFGRMMPEFFRTD